ncbi:serine protease [Halobacteria archaeon AArc-curdl1]|uniref:Serine protease n=1 Tax=Natronosalvus hydrolyticus TaxID=2979988 RepID=A0AAP3E607_9EURY|nr:serine protease [Halobacteria archaeon AArc-curdl1]
MGDQPEQHRKSLSRRVVLRSTVAGGLVASSGCLTANSSTPEHASDDEEAIHETALEMGLDARSSVVKVGSGTGWVVDDGLVATCSHVVDDGETDIETFGGQRREGRIVEQHDDADLALLAGETDDLEPLALETEIQSVETPVMKVGHPDAVGTWIISSGRVVRLRGDRIFTDVPCGPGDSGSPLLTLDGAVIGHVTGSAVLVDDPEELDAPETLVQNYEGQRHVSRAYTVDAIAQLLEESTSVDAR